MTRSKSCELVYRASRDGFNPSDLHAKCENKTHLVSIIRNNLNYVFGGYTSVAWNRNSEWITDPNAFIFSLRRKGMTKNDKFMVKNNGRDAFCGNIRFHLWYGNDICIINSSNKYVDSYCSFGSKYQFSTGLTYKTVYPQRFLAENFCEWLTTEIEVYQIKL